MNVPLVRDLRDALCLRILAEVQEFETRTGMRVTGMSITRRDITTVNDTSPRCVPVDVDVEVSL